MSSFFERIILKIYYIVILRKYTNSLPTTSNIEHPKMEYEGMSGSFIWEDEGLWEVNHRLADAFKSVIHQRMKMVIGPENDVGVMHSKKFDKSIFNIAKKYYPNWIGFREDRCTYHPEIAERMMRILKVADWRIKKMFDEDINLG